MFILFLLLGIACKIINANGWFIIPSDVESICFTIAAILAIIRIIAYFFVGKTTRDVTKKFRSF